MAEAIKTESDAERSSDADIPKLETGEADSKTQDRPSELQTFGVTHTTLPSITVITSTSAQNGYLLESNKLETSYGPVGAQPKRVENQIQNNPYQSLMVPSTSGIQFYQGNAGKVAPSFTVENFLQTRPTHKEIECSVIPVPVQSVSYDGNIAGNFVQTQALSSDSQTQTVDFGNQSSTHLFCGHQYAALHSSPGAHVPIYQPAHGTDALGRPVFGRYYGQFEAQGSPGFHYGMSPYMVPQRFTYAFHPGTHHGQYYVPTIQQPVENRSPSQTITPVASAFGDGKAMVVEVPIVVSQENTAEIPTSSTKHVNEAGVTGDRHSTDSNNNKVANSHDLDNNSELSNNTQSEVQQVNSVITSASQFPVSEFERNQTVTGGIQAFTGVSSEFLTTVSTSPGINSAALSPSAPYNLPRFQNVAWAVVQPAANQIPVLNFPQAPGASLPAQVPVPRPGLTVPTHFQIPAVRPSIITDPVLAAYTRPEQFGRKEPMTCLWVEGDVSTGGAAILAQIGVSPVCGKQFVNVEEMVYHLGEVHVSSRGPNTTELHYCRWKDCTRNEIPFKAKYKLVNHLRVHTGENIFAKYLCREMRVNTTTQFFIRNLGRAPVLKVS